jgi:uncharacterized protein YjeT (DUF2065 family)
VAPGKQDEEQLVDNVRVGDVEVVLEGRVVEPAVNLEDRMLASMLQWAQHSGVMTHVLFKVFLAVLEGVLPHGGGDLGRRVVHEVAILPKHIGALAGLALLVWIAIGALCLRLRRRRRRGGSKLWDCRDVLRHWMVQRGRGPVVLALHASRDGGGRCGGVARLEWWIGGERGRAWWDKYRISWCCLFSLG